MRILATHPLSPRLTEAGLGELVIYRPELTRRPDAALARALLEHCPAAALLDCDRLDDATLVAWRERAGFPVQLVRRLRPGQRAEAVLPGIDVHDVLDAGDDPRADLRALGLAERGIARHQTAQRLSSHGISAGVDGRLTGQRVTLVGAGIINLLVALELQEHGATVEILDASPDPRTKPPWQRLGCTHGGDDARMFSYTEADNYNEKGHLVYAKMHQVFRRTICEGGWLAVPTHELGPSERAWIEGFHELPRWQAEVFTEDIHAFTIASDSLWEGLRRRMPHLFEEVGYAPGILRLYAQPDKADAAEALHGRLGSLVRALDPDELARRHPACRDAVEDGQITRGLEVRGFTLNIHHFVRRILAHLEAKGARLRWNERVHAIERTDDGRVCGLRTTSEAVRSDHYVLSPGVLGNELLAGTRSKDKLQGILGLWMSLPNLEPRLHHSIKLHREGHVGEDSNVTLAHDADGRPRLILGSGYGYLGLHPLDMGSAEIARLFEALEHTAQRYFPRAYEAAAGDGTLRRGRKACVRPFTPTGLGIFEVLGTPEGGRLVVASGHNTGGFAQAPVVAEAVAATLRGIPHPMQALYDPERGIPEHLRAPTSPRPPRSPA